jgi:hypothetical protein
MIDAANKGTVAEIHAYWRVYSAKIHAHALITKLA